MKEVYVRIHEIALQMKMSHNRSQELGKTPREQWQGQKAGLP